MEVFWKIDAGKHLNIAINPDFGQVESDELVVNFSSSETFYSDKRPFFSRTIRSSTSKATRSFTSSIPGESGQHLIMTAAAMVQSWLKPVLWRAPESAI